MTAVNYHALIREVPDFPKPGILFYDITTLLKDARALASIADELTAYYQGQGIAKVIGIESRGFIFGGNPGEPVERRVRSSPETREVARRQF